jgi:hypothetical protein
VQIARQDILLLLQIGRVDIEPVQKPKRPFGVEFITKMRRDLVVHIDVVAPADAGAPLLAAVDIKIKIGRVNALLAQIIVGIEV